MTRRMLKMINSSLHDEKTFYQQFMKDLVACKQELIVESPFITSARMRMLYPIFETLVNRGEKEMEI